LPGSVVAFLRLERGCAICFLFVISLSRLSDKKSPYCGYVLQLLDKLCSGFAFLLLCP
jgi:hypothetical protein